MINNSSLQKWDRLKQKQLDNQFINALIQGMNCSMFEAKAITNCVYETYQPYFDNAGAMKPGQVLFEVVSIENGPQIKLANCKMVSVILTIDAGEQDLAIRQNHGVIGLRRFRLQRIANEAFQQGGLLTVEDIADRLLNCGEKTIVRDLAQLTKQGIVLPLRSVVKDMGRAVSHRTTIVKQWLLGKEYSEIARLTNHSVEAIASYIDKFRRVICLAKDNHEIKTIAFLVKLSVPLTEEYYRIYKGSEVVPHRKEELESLIKKTLETR
jgi:hypothetical protein